VRSRAWIALAIALASGTARAHDTTTNDTRAPRVRYSGPLSGYYRATMLDLNFEGGGGAFWGNRDSGVGFGRVRAGVMFAGWPVTTSFGATFEINNLSMATYGVQFELTHVASGGWFQLGALVDGRGNFGGLASVGFSIFGIEAQVRGYDEVRPSAFDGNYGFALLGKVRIPLGYILYALSRK